MPEDPPTKPPGRGAGVWVEAAAAAFAAGGLDAVRVEPLARQLRVTKGSFYWHFPDRHALVMAVIQRWEEQETNAIIAESERGDTAGERLRRLLVAVTERMGTERDEQRLYLETEHDDVRAAVERVTDRRLDYLRDLLVELGLDPVDAEQKSALGLSAAIGMDQLVAGAPAAMQRPMLERDAFVEFLYAILVSQAPA